jgi:aldehyde dehydrogenase
VLEAVRRPFHERARRGRRRQADPPQLAKLTAVAFTNSKDAGGCSHPVLNRKLVGADAAVLASTPARPCPPIAQCSSPRPMPTTPYVLEEQMMPMLPVVRVKTSTPPSPPPCKSEHGYKHSAMIHSLNVDHMTQMARALDTTLFVKNGPSVAGLGLGGEGYLSYSIATTTGEGITTPGRSPAPAAA